MIHSERQREANDRDLSRAYWQRSVGQVLMSELADRLYDTQIDPVTENSVRARDTDVRRTMGVHPATLPWARAYVLSEHFIQLRAGSGLIPHSAELESQTRQHTFNQFMDRAFQEGLDAQITAPLNIARYVSQAAGHREVPGFETDSLMDIAHVLRRPDFQSLINDGAFTKNGVWGSFSTARFGTYAGHYDSPDLDFAFTDGQVAYTPEFNRYLKQKLAAVNRQGNSSDTSHPNRTSSGCPVRHERPHFTDSAEDRHNLQLLSRYFGKTIEELTAPRKQNVIVRGLNVQADILEQADTIYSRT